MRYIIFLLLGFVNVGYSQCDLSVSDIVAKIDCTELIAQCPNLGSSLDNDPSNEIQTLTTTNTVIYHEQFAGGANGNTGTLIWSRNSVVTALATLGTYSVVFSSPHPDGINYHVSLSGQENNNRDNPKITVIQGTKTAVGFNVMVTGDDNGGGADFFDNNPWSFGVDAPVQVLQNVTISN